jgi:uncharacterized protein with von Willebrand factor type A (vWA) domain
MDQRIVEFITAMRAAGVRISLAESADAFQAVDSLGIQDRETFRISLRSSLIKDNADLETFDTLFPLFFQTGSPPPLFNPNKEMTPDEARKLAQALRQFSDEIRKMLEKLMNGEPLNKYELQQLDQLINQSNISDLRYQNWLSRQMEQAMNFREVRQAIEDLAQMLRQMGMNRQRVEELRQMLQSNQQALQDQIHQYAGQRIAENMSRQNRHDRMDNLYNLPFHSLTEEEMHELRKEVRRMAAILRTRVALRMKRARNGLLDVKSTLRANLKNSGVPFDIRHRDRSLKPRIVLLCDVSTSMRYCSELMLSLLGEIQDQISKTHAFAFIDHLEYITPLYADYQPGEAIGKILHQMPSGHYNTDLGYSLKNFMDEFYDTVDSRTTFLIVGDGRNNFNDPRVDLFRDIAHRSRYTLWFNPEPLALWGSGDSDILKYQPHCKQVFQVSNLTQLAAAIDHLLVSNFQ